MKLNYVSGNSLTTVRYLSAQPAGTGKDTGFEVNKQNPRPIVLPPETIPSAPSPNRPYNPVVEIPGFKKLSFLQNYKDSVLIRICFDRTVILIYTYIHVSFN